LPPLQNRIDADQAREPNVTAFAHASEREFTGLLTFYGVAWQYEPATFPLEWDDLGRVTEAFTPDFYLPEHDLYIELTTKEQRLMTEKHRKIRKLQILHPDVRIRLLSREDYLALARRFGWRGDTSGNVGT
jgi:hypoxanthine phosphoribosyltransferase